MTSEQWISYFDDTYAEKLDRRAESFRHATSLFLQRQGKVIVETGTIRNSAEWGIPIGDPRMWRGDGLSTILFSDLCSRTGAMLYSVDASLENVGVSRKLTLQWEASRSILALDSVEFLESFPLPIDLLYLDSFDFEPSDPGPSQLHNLREAKAALPSLHENSIVLIDDADQILGGKGGMTVPFLIKQGWTPTRFQRQFVLSHTT